MMTKLLIYLLLPLCNPICDEFTLQFLKNPQIVNIKYYLDWEYGDITLCFTTYDEQYTIDTRMMGLDAMTLLPFDPDNDLIISIDSVNVYWEMVFKYTEPRLILQWMEQNNGFGVIRFNGEEDTNLPLFHRLKKGEDGWLESQY